MKTIYGTILVLAMVVLLTAPLPCEAAEKEEKTIWSENEPKQRHRRFELTDEKIEHIMNRLKKANPEKAKELEELRAKDPEKFKAELRKVTREQFGKEFRERTKNRSERHMRQPRGGGQFGRGGMPHGVPGVPGMPGMPGMGMHRRHGELLEWLEKNYPEVAEQLRDMREDKPELFERRMGLGLKKYGRILEAARENPELAKVLKEDLELKEKRDRLLRRIRAASDDERGELVENLEEVISSRFNLIVRRKQVEYEQLHKKLEKLQKRVKQSEAEVEKWKDDKFKKENVKARLEELVSKTEKFKWD